ncbi:MAG: class I SAM-dependent methyltransferase [Thermoplasmata archaeon]
MGTDGRPVSASQPAAGDFRGLDFSRIWKDRGQVTTLESRVLARALATTDRRRVLEAGCGDGRLSTTVQAGATEYLGVDLVPEFLAKVPLPGPAGPRFRMIVADVRRLPFASESVTACVMVRAFNFLADPGPALTEIRRVLVPGGRAVVTSHVHPSLGTLADDVRYTLRPPSWSPYRRVGLDQTPRRGASPTVFPTWTWSRSALRRLSNSAGFLLVGELATGLEEYPGLRRLPPRVLEPFAEAAGSHWGLPMRWLVLERPGRLPKSLPPWREVLSCPVCHARAEGPVGRGLPSAPCDSCGFRFRDAGGLLDARYETGGGAPTNGLAPVSGGV